MAFSQTLRNFQKIMLAISTIWLCLFFENLSILTKTLILGHPPGKTHHFKPWQKIIQQTTITYGRFDSVPIHA